MPLDNNPQKGKTDKSYIRNGIVSDKKNNYGKRTIKNLSFSSNDFKKIKSKIRNYKKRQKKSKELTQACLLHCILAYIPNDELT